MNQEMRDRYAQHLAHEKEKKAKFAERCMAALDHLSGAELLHFEVIMDEVMSTDYYAKNEVALSGAEGWLCLAEARAAKLV